MFIPRVWRRATRTARGLDGRGIELTAWGWSTGDEREAETKAEERLASLVARVERGDDFPDRYPYGARPLREEIIEDIRARGEVSAVVTRNGYGALVLNARDALFIDVDRTPPTPPRDAQGLFVRLFKGTPRKPPAEDPTLGRIREALREFGDASFRIYATAAGYRVLATHPTFEPASPVAEQVMTEVGADPTFVQLCRAQKSFRARLTPKPWRCSLALPPGVYPRDDADTQASFARWLDDYERACAGRGVCRFLDQVGWGRVHDDVRAILERHDQATRATEALPLA